MAAAKIAISPDRKVRRRERARLVRECAKLNPKAEQVLADEGISEDLATWPPY